MRSIPAILVAALVAAPVAVVACSDGAFPPSTPLQTEVVSTASGRPGPSVQRIDPDPQVTETARLIREGRHTFRFDTFGDETFWGDALKLHQAIAGRDNGGFGAGVSPKAALAVGLKVDAEAIPPALAAELQAGRVDLDDPATTLALLQLDAVVGLKGIFNPEGQLTSLGITCAICHSTVDDSFAPGIGRRLDGWAARDLNIGAIVNLSPDLTPVANVLGVDEATVRRVLAAWGPGKYDAQLLLDGKGFRPDGETAATVLPPAFGLAGNNLHTYTGFGSVPYWNAYVAITQMHGQGNFFDPRLNNPEKHPIAVRNGTWNIRVRRDRVASKLPGLQAYQLSIPPPAAPPGSFDQDARRRGQRIFNGAAQCSTCHVPPLFTESGWALHTAQEIGIEDFQAMRSPDERYRTTPLRGLWTHTKGGFYHDGRFPTLDDVVRHYQGVFKLDLSDEQRRDLVEYLKSL